MVILECNYKKGFARKRMNPLWLVVQIENLIIWDNYLVATLGKPHDAKQLPL